MNRAERRRLERQAGYRGKKSKRNGTQTIAVKQSSAPQPTRPTAQDGLAKTRVRSLGVWVP